MTTLVWAAPWLVAVALVPLLFRKRLSVSDFPKTVLDPPFVSIIVPARNEATNIAPCVGTLLNSDYEQREIIVVNDGSTDETGSIARALAERAPNEMTVVDTEPLPEGWVGKNWACWTGYKLARGEILLFTDADTRHDDDALGHAVGARHATKAGLLSLMPQQVMESFWERVVLPHIFLPIHLRFLSLERVNSPRSPRVAIANGQFMMMPRAVYESIGGHEAVRGEVVEDMRLAQLVVSSGQKVVVADAQDLMETRMYTSLSEITEGWTKNLDRGARLSFPPGVGRVALCAGALLHILLWVVPPIVLPLGFFVPFFAPAREWALIATVASIAGWMFVHLFLRTQILYAFFYPLGALVAAYFMLRSSLRGDRVAWRGREYRLSKL
jgi:chlorobactene glucosyltransferase